MIVDNRPGAGGVVAADLASRAAPDGYTLFLPSSSVAINMHSPRAKYDLNRDFAPMFMIDLQQKDLRIALATAQKDNTPLPGTALVNQLMAANQAMGEGREGTQAMVKTLERLARLV